MSPRKARRDRMSRDLPTTNADDAEPVQPVVLNDRVPPQNCPHCGRGMQPRVKRTGTKNGNRYADCSCRLCGKSFDYYYPKVRKR